MFQPLNHTVTEEYLSFSFELCEFWWNHVSGKVVKVQLQWKNTNSEFRIFPNNCHTTKIGSRRVIMPLSMWMCSWTFCSKCAQCCSEHQLAVPIHLWKGYKCYSEFWDTFKRRSWLEVLQLWTWILAITSCLCDSLWTDCKLECWHSISGRSKVKPRISN